MKKKAAPPPPRRREWWPPALIALAVVLVYANSLGGPFVFDDRGTIVDNTTIEDLGSPRVWSAPHETPTAGRPVVNLSFALNHALGGREVAGYHVVNVAIHALAALLLLAVLRLHGQPARRSLGDGGALAVALIWAVHPLNSEAVDYVTQRTESLMALFYLLTMYCAIRAHGKRAGKWEAFAVVACALGMASKESMVTAPLAVLLYDRVFLFASFREALRARARLYAGLASTWIVLAALIGSAPRNLSAGFSAPDADAWTYLLNQAVMITRYLWLALWPRDLVLFYGSPLPLTLGDVWPRAALLVGLLLLTVFAFRRHRGLAFLGAWFFLTLAPTSSIMPIATEVGAERRMYLPLIAVVALGLTLFRTLVPSARARAAALVAVTLLLGAGTAVRNVDYRSSLRLAETSFERWPVPATHSMLGTELAAAGRLTEAERHLRDAAPAYPPARYYLGTVLKAQGKHADAIAQFEAFIDSQPAELDQVYLARALLAESLTKEQRLDDAAMQYRSILAAQPEDDQAIVLLAQVLLRQQRFADAIPLFRKAAALRPADVSVLNSLGIALASSGQLDEAITTFQRAVDLDPQHQQAQQNLARALSLRGK